ncbi:SET domain [Phytophthora cactorum]|nr:SET domain [Phytophthora cactorum]
MICQSDRTIPITSTAARVRHAHAACLAVGIQSSRQRSATTTRMASNSHTDKASVLSHHQRPMHPTHAYSTASNAKPTKRTYIYVDALKCDSITHFICHACDPNAAFVEQQTRTRFKVLVKMILDVNAGTQITVYYGTDVGSNAPATIAGKPLTTTTTTTDTKDRTTTTKKICSYLECNSMLFMLDIAKLQNLKVVFCKRKWC